MPAQVEGVASEVARKGASQREEHAGAEAGGVHQQEIVPLSSEVVDGQLHVVGSDAGESGGPWIVRSG
jgi:hypothetical protein